MQLFDWLDADPGRAAALAQHLRISRGALSQWRPFNVPVRHMPAIARFTKGKVTVAEMASARATAFAKQAKEQTRA